ncbi:hypothetical protein FPZ12_034540 [Amycolatopsis acidicola]|uniref:Uncharacterized protein n=1 Tax=Amycolatopsis acidicola TaxID=2596893 RepID=A0A5N0UTP9_9PSEU|nr:hypothetical protein [Amycolatopsis acidicola]KAA9153463.1 hypothetical protein FPZ12_034540 [Amycolatopsis acidicola]
MIVDVRARCSGDLQHAAFGLGLRGQRRGEPLDDLVVRVTGDAVAVGERFVLVQPLLVARELQGQGGGELQHAASARRLSPAG